MLKQQQSQKTSDKEIIPDQVKKMDEEISVNELLSIEDDILDNEDDMERWSDFSIEEELPMHSESKYSKKNAISRNFCLQILESPGQKNS